MERKDTLMVFWTRKYSMNTPRRRNLDSTQEPLYDEFHDSDAEPAPSKPLSQQ